MAIPLTEHSDVWRRLERDGITRDAARGDLRLGARLRLFRGVYGDGPDELAPLLRARAAVAAAGPAAVAVSTTAALLHGFPVVSPPPRPEVAVQGRTGSPQRRGMRLRVCQFTEADLAVVAGVVATSAPRTLVVLLRERDRLSAIVACEFAIGRGAVSPTDLDDALHRSAGARWILRARERRALVAPQSGSPLETAIRLRLHDGGLPPPPCSTRYAPRTVTSSGSSTWPMRRRGSGSRVTGAARTVSRTRCTAIGAARIFWASSAGIASASPGPTR